MLAQVLFQLGWVAGVERSEPPDEPQGRPGWRFSTDAQATGATPQEA